MNAVAGFALDQRAVEESSALGREIRMLRGIMAVDAELHDQRARPSQGNRSRTVEDPALQKRNVDIVSGLVTA